MKNMILARFGDDQMIRVLSIYAKFTTEEGKNG